MTSRYNKGNAPNSSSLHYGSGGPSALSLYTNKTPANKSSSGYTSDHYSSPSSLHSYTGYISDISTSHVSKSNYPSNTYGSSPGVKTYSSYPYSSSTVSRNLTANTSRVSSLSYSRSNGFSSNLSPNSGKYVSNYSKTNTQNTYSDQNFDKNNNKKDENKETEEVSNKAPADFTSDSEEDDNGVDMRTHTNIIVTSRSTSPNRDISHLRIDSISSTQQIIRPKKVVFGVSAKKIVKQTQVNEQDLERSLHPPISISPARSPSRSITPTYLTPSLTPNHSPSGSPSPCPSPVRMRYGCTPNRRQNNSLSINRYSMPVIRSPTCAADYSNYSSISDSNTSQRESKTTAQPSTSNEIQIHSKENSLETMPAINDNETNDKNNQQMNDKTKDSTSDQYNSDQNNNKLLTTDPKSSTHRRSLIRLSPSVIRRRRSQSRGKLSGRSRSRSKEKFLDREESSTTLTSSSDEDDEHNKSESDRHSRVRKKKGSKNSDSNNECKESIEDINELKVTKNDCIESRTTIKPPNNASDSDRKSRSKSSTNESSSSPEKVIIKKPSLRSVDVSPTIVVTKLPMKIKDPYSTETECDESEFVDESDAENFSECMSVMTIRLNSSPETKIISDTSVKPKSDPTRRSSTDTLSESSDNSSKSCKSVKLNENKSMKSVDKSVITDERVQTNSNSTKNKNLSFVTNCEKNESNDKSMGFRDNQTNILSDFKRESICSQRVESLPSFPKEDNNMKFKIFESKDVCLRDSGFSESSTRPDSPYDNLKPIAVSDENVGKNGKNTKSNERVSTEKQFVCEVNDIDSLLTEGLNQNNFGELERKFQMKNKIPLKLKDESRTDATDFICKYQDIDEMIDPMGPTSPLSPNHLSNFNSSYFRQIFENIEEEDSVAVDVSDVKVHNSEAMKSTVISIYFYFVFEIFVSFIRFSFSIFYLFFKVEAYTEEIDSSAVRIRENKALSVHLSKITEEIEEDFNQNLVNRIYQKSTKVRNLFDF